ncbi:MAG: hypothetical protein ACP5JF_04495 [Candidatus Methanodesulfokora sp.]|jgi:hypothetical protein
MLSAHIKILERLVESNGMSASRLIYNREYRERVVDYLRRNGFVVVSRSGAGIKLYPTEKARRLVANLARSRPR